MTRGFAVVLLCTAGLIGCASPAYGPGEEPLAWDPPPRPDAATHRVYDCPLAEDRDHTVNITPEEGAYLAAGRHLLDLPPGTTSGNPRLRMREHAGSYVVVSFRPVGERFAGSAILTLSTARCTGTVPSPAGVIRYRPDRGWESVPSQVVGTTRQEMRTAREYRVQVELDGFSSYALVAP